ncbi:MAG: hypothetical protein A4E57_03031 [Syntrophorhabdaceae bacterium PtaU1.Bin034]|nr:MAG: hypothetical protein A4E57_03031 [Syntrophorhabdaceae bacterium PtaU1.Bin034]
MAVLFTQSWDVIQGREEAYSDFVNSTLLPGMTAIGLAPVGSYYVEVGSGPRIIGVHRAASSGELFQILRTSPFKQLALQVKPLVCNYRTSILEPVGRTKYEDYVIQKGVWKFSQYYDLKQGRKREYGDFVLNEYIPALEKLDYVEVTGGWNVILGGVSEIIGELTFRDPVDIGGMLNSQEFRQANLKLQDEFVTNYQNRIMRCTERFDEPKWFRL